MTTIHLIRHAETELNVRANEIVGGRSNHAKLSETGKKQPTIAGRWLRRHGIIPDLAISSGAVRTNETLYGILAVIKPGMIADIITDEQLQEMSQGIKEGADRRLTYTDEVLAQIASDPMNFRFPGGESVTDVGQRMLNRIIHYAQSSPEKTIIMSSHGLSIRCLAGAIYGWSHKRIIFETSTPNCSITTISATGKDLEVVGDVGRDILSEQLAYESQIE